jgi:hypothetical protein
VNGLVSTLLIISTLGGLASFLTLVLWAAERVVVGASRVSSVVAAYAFGLLLACGGTVSLLFRLFPVSQEMEVVAIGAFFITLLGVSVILGLIGG